MAGEKIKFLLAPGIPPEIGEQAFKMLPPEQQALVAQASQGNGEVDVSAPDPRQKSPGINPGAVLGAAKLGQGFLSGGSAGEAPVANAVQAARAAQAGAAPESMGALGYAGLGAAGMAATAAGRKYAQKQGGNTETAWGVGNAMNPFNQILEAPGALKNMVKGDGGQNSWGTSAALAIPTAGLSLATKLFGSGKGKDQIARDSLRSRLQDTGIMDDKWNINLNSGNSFNTAQGTKDEWMIKDPQDATSGKAIGLTQALSSLLTGQGNSGSQAQQMTGFLTNSLLNSKTANTDARGLYEKAGFTKDSALAALDQMLAQGKLEKDVGDAYKNGVIDAFGGTPTTASTQSTSSSSSSNRSSTKKSGGKDFKNIPAVVTPSILSTTDWTTPNPNVASPTSGNAYTYADYANSIKNILNRNAVGSSPLTRRL